MNGLDDGGDDGLPRVARLLAVTPIAVAAFLAIASSLLVAGEPGGRLCAFVLGVAAASLIAAAGSAWLVMDRVVSRQLRGVAEFLRAAQEGREIDPPRALGGALADIVERAREIARAQIQSVRREAGSRDVDAISEFIDVAAREAQAEHAAISRAVIALAGEIRGRAAPSAAQVSEAVVGEVRACVTAILNRHVETQDVTSALDSIRRGVEAARDDAKAASEALTGLSFEIRATERDAARALRALVEANSPANDRRPDALLDRVREVGDKLDALAKTAGERPDDKFEARLRSSLADLRVDVERGLATMSGRVERAAEDIRRRAEQVAAFDSGAITRDARADVARIEAALATRIEAAFALRIDGLRPLFEALSQRMAQISENSSRLIGQFPDVAAAMAEVRRSLASQAAVLSRLQAPVGRVADAAPHFTARDLEPLIARLDDVAEIKRAIAAQAAVLSRLQTPVAPVSDAASHVTARDLEPLISRLDDVAEIKRSLASQSVVLSRLHIARVPDAATYLAARDLEPLIARLDGLGARLEVVSRAPAMIADMNAALVARDGVEAARAGVTETIARGVEKALILLSAIQDASSIAIRIAEAAAATSAAARGDFGRIVGEIASLREGVAAETARAVTLLRDVAETGRELRDVAAALATSGKATDVETQGLADTLSGLETRVGDAIAKSSSVLDEIRALPAAVIDQARMAGVMAADVTRALSGLAAPDPAISNDRPASSSELSVGFESVHERLSGLARGVEETLSALARAEADDVERSDGTRAASRQIMDAVVAVHALVGSRAASAAETAPKRFGWDPDAVSNRIEDVNARLDHLAERLDILIEQTPALARESTAPPEGSAGPLVPLELNGLGGRMDDVAARLDELGGLIEMVAGRQGRFEPFMAQALAPITERLVGLADLGGRGFDRLAGQFGQLSSVVSALPRSLADEVRARIATPAVDLSAVLRRLDDLGETFTDLVATVGAANDDAPPPMDAPGRGGSRALAPFSAAMSINAEPFLGPEMDALHGRLDYIAARIDRISDYIEGDAEPFRRGAKGAVVASGANAWEFESRETLRRLDDFGALLTRSGLAELPRVAEQIGASSQALASAIGEWRASSGSALTRPMVEDALERWFARLGRLGGQDAVIAAIEDLRAEAREARAFAPAAANDGGERIEGLGRAVVAVHGRFDEIVARLDRLAGRDDAAGRRGAALAAHDTSAQGHAIERLDRVRDSIEALDARVETGNRAVSRVLALVEKQDGQDLGAKLEQSNQAIAETLLSFESRWEQPLAELREAVQRIVASAQSGSAAGPGHAGGPAATDSLVAALATMGGFMAAIEERFDALESVAEDVKAGSPDWTKSPGLATLSEGVGEMRRLTQEFLDISCAITDELASSAKAA